VSIAVKTGYSITGERKLKRIFLVLDSVLAKKAIFPHIVIARYEKTAVSKMTADRFQNRETIFGDRCVRVFHPVVEQIAIDDTGVLRVLAEMG
jgi:hypothetical protein